MASGIATPIDTAKRQMVSSFRHILVMLLLLLQIVAPLVHAHVGDDEIGGGLHLHGFENLALPGHGSHVQSADRQIGMAMIVVIGSAIERQLADMDGPPAVLPELRHALPPVCRQLHRLKPVSSSPLTLTTLCHKQHPPRAPPV